MIKAAMSNLPIYYMSICRIPVVVANEVEKVQAVFLWGDTEVRKKVHLVKWKELAINKSKGGLGIPDIRTVNSYLLMKWWWRFGFEKNVLWKNLICSKYPTEGGKRFPNQVVNASLSNVWSDIIGVLPSINGLLRYFMENIKIVIRDGNRISFWRDIWCGEIRLL